MQLSIIIISYNVRYFLEQCLFSVQKAAQGIGAEVIVVDNHSTDGSVAYLAPLFPQVIFISNSENLGFARANNQALEICRGEYVLFLNPDTLIAEDCLEKCITYIKANPQIGALGVRMLDGKGLFLPESKRAFPTPAASLFKLTGLAALFPRSGVLNAYALGNLDPLKNHEVGALAGAFFFSRKNLLQELDGFDEQFFLYGEDLDLSYRIRKAGFQNWYFAGTEIIHFKGESSGRTKFNHTRFFYTAMLVFVQKHYSRKKARLFSFFLKLAILFRSAVTFTGRLVKPLLLPLADAVCIWTALQLMRSIWIDLIRKGLDFHVAFIPFALPMFAILFVLAAALAGMYDRYYKTSRALLAAAFGALCMVAVYALLPETVRFSRGVIMTGGLLGAGLVILLRLLFFRKIHLWMGYEWEQPGLVMIIGDEKSSTTVKEILATSFPAEQVMDMAALDKHDNLLEKLRSQKQIPATREIILCEGTMPLTQVIQHTKQMSRSDIRILFHLSGSHSIVGSDLRGVPGRSFGVFLNYRIAMAYQQRMKRITDILVSLLLVVTSPVFILFYKNGVGLLKKALLVVKGTHTWIGYINPSDTLPVIRPGIITHAGPHPGLDGGGAAKFDTLYAKNYDWWQDIVTIIRNGNRLA